MAPYQKTNASRRLLKRISIEEKTHSIKVVGLGRLELPTSRLSSARSNQLSYKPLTTRGRTCTHPFCPDAAQRSPWRVFVREERETKTAASRLWSSTDLAICWPLNVSEEIREI